MDDLFDNVAAYFAEPGEMFTSSPLYQALCPAVAGERGILALLRSRRPGQQPPFLLFGAAHYLLLSGAQHPLRDFYPSVGGSKSNVLDAVPAFIDFCRTHEEQIRALVSTKLVQTNVVNRAAALRFGLWEVRRRWPGPVHLIDAGTSAGTHLLFDRYKYRVGDREFGDLSSSVNSEWRSEEPVPDLDDMPEITSRIGIDLNPVDVTDDEQRLWLRSLVWPEDHRKAETLVAALNLLAEEPPEVVSGSVVAVLPAIAERLPDGDARVVFHAAVRMHLTAEDAAAFDTAIDALAAGGPLFHIWLEPSSAPHYGYSPDHRGTLQMHGPGGEAPEVIAAAEGHLAWLAPLAN
ncbi:MAG: DUF2332 domain-containing protein [Acidothermaceae bacterium]